MPQQRLISSFLIYLFFSLIKALWSGLRGDTKLLPSFNSHLSASGQLAQVSGRAQQRLRWNEPSLLPSITVYSQTALKVDAVSGSCHCEGHGAISPNGFELMACHILGQNIVLLFQDCSILMSRGFILGWNLDHCLTWMIYWILFEKKKSSALTPMWQIYAWHNYSIMGRIQYFSDYNTNDYDYIDLMNKSIYNSG